MSAGLFEPLLVPPVFDGARAARSLSELDEAAPDVLGRRGFRRLIEAACGNSPYLARLARREAAFLPKLLVQDPLDVLRALEAEAMAVADAADMAEAMRRLRAAKGRVALTVALSDIAGLLDLDGVTGALTRFADAAVKGALRFLLRAAAAKAAMDASPEALEDTSGLFILAMGKMGAHELNYSSDIDLVVFYDEERFPFRAHDEKSRAAVDLVQGLLKLLAEPTVDGYVFRVDLRLRPDAGATRIAISTEAAEAYYELMGQNWERAAMIKARACAGDPSAAAAFLKSLAPFVWRKHLDYAAIDDIHSIKRQIHAHAGHEKVAVLGHNIKLGRGGIREIEFFVQTQQLILGGRDPSLRDPRTLGALAALRARGLISEQAERELTEAYRFLRTLEHRLQMIDDEQTHTLPKTADGLDHIARFMGFADTGAFEDMLLGHLTRVEANYARLFESAAPLASKSGSLVFTGVEDDPETVATLSRLGFSAPSDVAAVIRGWHHGRIRATRSARARELLTKLMPALLEALSKTADPQTAFAQFDRFLSGLPAGVQVFSMLLAHPALLDLVASIAGAAPRLADYLGRNAAVLDALTDADFLTAMPSRGGLEGRFAAERARLPGYEGALDAARRFAREEMFRVGVQVIQGLASAEAAGPAYAAVAETVIAGLQPAVEAEVAAQHGPVNGGAFAVVALGKLGGREMTAGSDLDVVFVYTHDPDAGASEGARPLAPAQYFARVSQRFIAALTAMTTEGRLYDVDMRLRPSGNQGPVAVRLDSFADYHRAYSWTWEKMALTRARAISGPPALRDRVTQIIRDTLARPVERSAVLQDAREMRERLAAQFPGRDRWDIKFAPGGLVDIEFVAQALQLCHAASAPVLDQNTMAAIEKLAQAGALSPEDAETLIGAARLEHALTQVLRIALDGPFKSESATRGLKALLARAGGAKDFPALEHALAAAQARARDVFERVMAG